MRVRFETRLTRIEDIQVSLLSSHLKALTETEVTDGDD